jgi:hypothetical protein
VNAFMIERMVRQALERGKRARVRALLCSVGAVALAVAGTFGAGISVQTGATGPMALTLTAFGGATACAVWAGWAFVDVARHDRRIVQIVSGAADGSVAA